MAKTSAPLDLIRKIGSRQAFEALTAAPPSDPVLELKLAAVDDPELFKVATGLATDVDDALTLYENMGGTFEKSAFGTPMFGQNQMTGSPALSAGASSPGGMAAPMPKAPSPAAPQAAQGGQGGAPMTTTTTTKQVVAPATAPSAPSAPSSSGGQGTS